MIPAMAATRTTAIEAIAEIPDGATIMVGGFGLVGAPLSLIDALVEHSTATDLTIISNNTGEAGRGLGLLLRQGRIKKAIASFFTSNPEAVEAAMTGAIEYELLPQGIGGFYTPVGAGTELGKGHEERLIDGVPHILQAPLRADVSLVYATWGDELGNLRYRRTAQNFNPAMASAGALTIAEVAEIRPVGGFEPEDVHTPHLYVDRLVERTLSLADVQGANA
jgi:3-oxoacid CoA-transferase subunit A/3-oxoadipate CoA-transferase alpha subunit